MTRDILIGQFFFSSYTLSSFICITTKWVLSEASVNSMFKFVAIYELNQLMSIIQIIFICLKQKYETLVKKSFLNRLCRFNDLCIRTHQMQISSIDFIIMIIQVQFQIHNWIAFVSKCKPIIGPYISENLMANGILT